MWRVVNTKWLPGGGIKMLLEILKNKGDLTFLKKWGFSIKFFKKYFLRSKSKFKGPLTEPHRNLEYYFDLFFCKLKNLYLKILSK